MRLSTSANDNFNEELILGSIFRQQLWVDYIQWINTFN